MPVVLELAGASGADVSAGVSPVAELMACLHTLAEPDHHPEAAPWVHRLRESVSEPLRVHLQTLAPLWARHRCRLLFPLDATLTGDLDAELAALEELAVGPLVAMAAAGIHGSTYDVTGLLDDPAAARAYVLACRRRSFTRGELAAALLDDPQRFRADLVATLRRCAEEFFDAEWRRVSARLQDEAGQVGHRLRRLPLPEALASVSPTASVRQRPLSVRFDKQQDLRGSAAQRRCLLVPSVHTRPHLIVKLDPHAPIVVHFPVADRTPSRQAPLAEVQTRLAILSDPARLSLCRHLVNEPITTSDLAERTGMTRPQVSRHLARLREAQLLTSEPSGRMVYHRLDTARLMQLGGEVLRTILR